MALAERVLLLLPSGGSVALMVTLPVEVVEDEVGLLEELDDVVPDDRFECVCANARVVAGCAALVGSSGPGAGVAADGALLDRLVECAAVGVVAGSAADLAFEEIVVALAARVACFLFVESAEGLLVSAQASASCRLRVRR